MQQRRSFNLSYRIQHAQGHVVWVNEQGRGEYDAENNLQWIDGFIWDSSELHQAEAQRQALQQRLNTFYQVAPVAIALNRLDDGQFIDGNPELFRLTGYTKEEFRTLSYWDITPESYASDEQRQLRKLQESGTYGPYEKVYISKSGQRIPVLLHGALISGEQGEPLIWSIIQDISSRVQAEQAQQEREQYLSAVLDNVIDAIITIDAQGIIQTFNAAAERIFAYPASAVVGRNVSCLMPAPTSWLMTVTCRITCALARHALSACPAKSKDCAAMARPFRWSWPSRKFAITACAALSGSSVTSAKCAGSSA